MISLLLILAVLEIASANYEEPCTTKHIGCYKDMSTRAINGGVRFTSSDKEKIVRLCQGYAMLRGWKYFAIESGNQCFTASDAGSTYNKYKSSDKCDENIVGRWAMDVYEIVDCENDNYSPIDESYKTTKLGCWGDGAVRILNARIKGTVSFKNSEGSDIRDLCKAWAVTKGYEFYAIEAGNECWTSNEAPIKYMLKGGALTCKNGRGGNWGMDVYRIQKNTDLTPPQYTMNLYGVYGCPEHGELNPRQCETLAKTLGLNYGSELTGGMVTWKNVPYRCSRTLNRLFWNTNANGNGNSDFTPVCNYVCPVRHNGCFEHDKNDNAQTIVADSEFGGWRSRGQFRSLCEKKAMDQGSMVFGVRQLAEKEFECITNLKYLKKQKTSKKCADGVGKIGDNIQNIYTIMC